MVLSHSCHTKEEEDKNKRITPQERAHGQNWSKIYEKSETTSIFPCCSKPKLHEKHPKYCLRNYYCITSEKNKKIPKT